MKKLKENSVWFYNEEFNNGGERKYRTFICNYGSQNNFLNMITKFHGHDGGKKWIKDRISESGNSTQLEISEKNPNCFIVWESVGRWGGNESIENLTVINPQR